MIANAGRIGAAAGRRAGALTCQGCDSHRRSQREPHHCERGTANEALMKVPPPTCLLSMGASTSRRERQVVGGPVIAVACWQCRAVVAASRPTPWLRCPDCSTLLAVPAAAPRAVVEESGTAAATRVLAARLASDVLAHQRAVLALLPRWKWQSRGPLTTCPLCLYSLEGGHRVVALPCLHTLHESCAARWAEHALTSQGEQLRRPIGEGPMLRCPTCKTRIDATAAAVDATATAAATDAPA